MCLKAALGEYAISMFTTEKGNRPPLGGEARLRMDIMRELLLHEVVLVAM
jgi:hypothetical protein